jgi:deoxycytidylate deaminase
MAAIVEARAKGLDLTGSSVYVFRRGLAGDVRMARPCGICMKGLIDAGVKEIIYTTDVGMARETIGG